MFLGSPAWPFWNVSNPRCHLGADNTVFDSVALSGAAPSELTSTGGPFNYSPADGNLMLDIQIAGGSGGGASFEDGGGAGPSGIIRYHNFGTGTTGFGLVTEFDFGPTSTVPEPALTLLLGMLLGMGLAGICIMAHRRKAA
jgi:hypothetical protein